MRRLDAVSLCWALVGSASLAFAQPVALKHKFVPDDLTVYRNEALVNSTCAMPSGFGGSVGFPMQMTMTVDHRRRVLSVSPQGIATIRSFPTLVKTTTRTTRSGRVVETISDGKVSRTLVDGQEMSRRPSPSASGMPGWLRKPYLTKMDSRGRILSDSTRKEKVKDFLEQLGPDLDLSAMVEGQPEFVVVFPDHAVSVGGGWAHRRPLALPGLAEAFEERITYTLVRAARDGAGRRVAAINFTAVAARSEGKSTDSRLDKYAATGVILWSVDEGKLVSMETTTLAVWSMPSPVVDGAHVGARARMSFQTRTSVARK